jgi:hypothetical protein
MNQRLMGRMITGDLKQVNKNASVFLNNKGRKMLAKEKRLRPCVKHTRRPLLRATIGLLEEMD